jgi:uncharacterized Ntn-hydrolase superfamily protein
LDREAKGDLADWLVAAFEATESTDCDIRGRQSEAQLAGSGQPTGKPLVDRKFDLRVKDYPPPVDEMKRLVRLLCAYL